jgi:flagellar motor component MotA
MKPSIAIWATISWILYILTGLMLAIVSMTASPQSMAQNVAALMGTFLGVLLLSYHCIPFIRTLLAHRRRNTRACV